MNKRILALLFSAVLLAVCLTACVGSQETSTPEENSTAATTTTAPVDPSDPTDPSGSEPSETDPADPGETTLPEDPGNNTTATPGESDPTRRPTRPEVTVTTVKITVPTQGSTLAKDKIVDLDGHLMTFGTAWRWQTTVSASMLDDILWHESMERVMEQYNCQIKVTSVYANTENIQTYYMAGRCPADIITMLYGEMFLPNLGAGYLQAWDEIEGNPINLADARWDINQLCISAFDGKLYGMSFPSCPGIPQLRHVVFANRTLLEANGVKMSDIYSAIDNKQWDWNKMRQYALATTKDVDGDGIIDTWGITGDWNFMFYDFVWSNGGRLITIKDGTVTATMDSEANIEAVTFLDKIINEDKVVYFPESFYNDQTWGSVDYNSVQEFKKGNTAFLFHEAWNCDQQMQGENPVKFKWALLPIPMGPKATDYVSPMNLGSCDAMLNILAPERATKAAIIYNAWARPVGDKLDYSDEQQENMFQADDSRSMAMYQMLGTKGFLDYGTAVRDLTTSFTHAAVSSVLWKLNSPVAAVQGLSGTFTREISAVFANATGKK